MYDNRTDEPDAAGADARPALQLLSNGRYSVLHAADGGGYSAYRGFALTRWSADAARAGDGCVLYVRDVEGGDAWTAGLQPSRHAPDAYATEHAPGRAASTRRDGDIETRLDLCVAADADAELRRYTLTNHGAAPRRLQLTTYAEAVLNTPAGDAGHPAFSKLFVQTGWLPERGALLAWRRLRSPGDEPLWFGHRLTTDAEEGDVEYETDRMRFIGRGRSLAAPRALAPGAALSGSVGNVLDPVFSLRREVTLAPGASVRVTAVYAAAADRAGVEAALGCYTGAAAVDAAFDTAAGAGPSAGAVAALGLPARWLENVALREHGTLPAPPPLPAPAGPAPRAEAGGTAADGEEPLRLFNGYGGFSADGAEYVIRLRPTEEGLDLPPLPWINVVANADVGFLASERGAGYTWSVNSRENRLTPWFNDPVSDPHGEALYLRDEASGALWSPMPGPLPAAGAYEVRHGFGYTRYRHESAGLEQEVTLFVPREDPVKLARVRLRNRGSAPRRLSLFSYAHWVLGGMPAETRGRVVTEHDPASGALLARNPERGEFAGRVAVAAAVPEGGRAGVSFTTDRAAFLGPHGTADAPAAPAGAAPLDGRTGAVADACAAFRVPLELAPGAEAVCLVLLGEAADADAARVLVERYADAARAERALAEVREHWQETVGAVRIETPSPGIDLMVNGWLTYQNLACRILGRSAFYQSGGAFGFRDQLQDSSALVYARPELTREQILRHAAHQFVEGDVLHWWHPPLSKGIRTRFADDLLWLPYITGFYVQSTGDASVLDEQVRFLTAPPLEAEEDEVFLVPEDSGERGSVYEHCCRAIDRSLTAGAHRLPLMGVGDWNDGMNRVGRGGRGESVWLGFFLYGILEEFIPLAEARGDRARAARYAEYRAQLLDALNDTGWDGAWYRRAYYDNGAPLGSAENDECRIDTIAQAWAVLSGAAPAARAAQALDAMERHLVCEPEGIIRLLTPAFDRTPHDPGYIKGYLPGVRENGGQYTHAALWAVRALAEAGRRERAAPLLEMLSPVSHARTPEEVAVYQTEPYVIAADVYGVAPHVGRGGWTWYTGSAGWMYRVALESVLGLQLQGGDHVALRPCVPADWPGFRVRYRLPDGATTYHFEVRAGTGGESTATLDGAPLAVADGAVMVPLRRDGAEHRVEVTLGPDVGPRYEPAEGGSEKGEG